MVNKSTIRCIIAVILGCAVSSFAGETHDLLRKGEWDRLRIALEMGADVNALENGEKTLLDIAYEADPVDEQTIAWLRKQGALRMSELTLIERTEKIADFVFASPRPPSGGDGDTFDDNPNIEIAEFVALQRAAKTLERLNLNWEEPSQNSIPDTSPRQPVEMDEQAIALPRPISVEPTRKLGCCAGCTF